MLEMQNPALPFLLGLGMAGMAARAGAEQAVISPPKRCVPHPLFDDAGACWDPHFLLGGLPGAVRQPGPRVGVESHPCVAR